MKQDNKRPDFTVSPIPTKEDNRKNGFQLGIDKLRQVFAAAKHEQITKRWDREASKMRSYTVQWLLN